MKPALVLIGVAIALAGCDQRMINQPKTRRTARHACSPTTGSNRSRPKARWRATLCSGTPQTSDRPPMSAALLARGRERFDIFCAPCHSRTGNGDGMIVQRSMPRPPSLHDARLRAAPDRHILQVITHGYGAMYAYADRVPPDDRWAIAAYVRVLQLSRKAEVAALSDDLRRELQENAR